MGLILYLYCPQAVGPAMQRANSGPINPTPVQLTKLRADLNIVEENVRVMNEMLTEITPEQEESDDITLLKVSTSESLSIRIYNVIFFLYTCT